MNYLTLTGRLSNVQDTDDNSGVRAILTFRVPQWDSNNQCEVLTPATVPVFVSKRVLEALPDPTALTAPQMTFFIAGSLDISKDGNYMIFANTLQPVGVKNPLYVNEMVVAGNMGGDPEVKTFESGSQKVKITVATKKFAKNADRPDWHEIQATGQTGDFVCQHLTKGRTVSVRGPLQERSWDDGQTGERRRRLFIKADRLNAMGSKDDGGNGGGNQGGNRGGYDDGYGGNRGGNRGAQQRTATTKRSYATANAGGYDNSGFDPLDEF